MDDATNARDADKESRKAEDLWSGHCVARDPGHGQQVLSSLSPRALRAIQIYTLYNWGIFSDYISPLFCVCFCPTGALFHAEPQGPGCGRLRRDGFACSVGTGPGIPSLHPVRRAGGFLISCAFDARGLAWVQYFRTKQGREAGGWELR